MLADVVTEAVLMMQAAAPAGLLAAALADGADLHPVVHQATGMVLAQLGTTADDAHLILQARAFADSRPMREVARDVIERRIRFTALPEPGEASHD